jgi:hypothetical protein
MCWLSWNLEASTFWNPQGLSRPVMGLLYPLYIALINMGARCWLRSWLRNYATSRKVAGSIPDDVIGIFHLHIPSGHTMALGSTQPLTEMSTRNISWGQIYCLSFKYRSTCFGHPHAHHQELINCSSSLWFTYCRKRYCYVNLHFRKVKRNRFTNILQLSLS